MSAAPKTNGRPPGEAAVEVRALVPEPAPVIEWTVATDGTLAFSGPVLEVLGAVAGSDVDQQVEALLAPILVVVRSGTGWDDYQLERVLDTPAGLRRLLIRCHQQHDGSGGHVGVIMNAAAHAQVEENLGDLIERYRLLVEISPDMIVVHQDGVLRYLNPTGVTWMGADDASELVGRPLTDFVAATSIGPLMERIADLDHPGAVSRPTEMTIVSLAGRSLLLEAQSVRTIWDGRPAFQVFLRDHSERRRAEAALRHQANLLASVSDAVVATDLDGHITAWNPAAADLYRLSGPEALGRTVRDVLGDGSTTDDGYVRPGEVEHIRADGTTVAVRVAVAPLRDEVGQHCGEVVVCADQSYRLLAAAERAMAESRFTTVVTALTEGIIVMESDGTINSMNPAARSFFGADGEGTSVQQLLNHKRLVDAQGATVPAGQDPVSLAVRSGASQRDRIIGFDDKHGTRRWLSMSCETLERRPDGQAASIMCSTTDVTDRRAGEERLTYAAGHDSLTGLANRSQLLTVLGECITAGLPATVLFVDLDRFKTVNDAHGHLAGDRVLCAVASRLRRQVDGSATVGRLAGDEFVVVMPDATNAATTEAAQLIRESIAQPIRLVDGREVVVTASIGIAGTAANEATAQALLSDADMAMYRAKQRGRSRIETCDGPLRAAMSRRVDLADRLGRAIADRQIDVHYQPIIRLDTGVTLGYEALARWTDRDLGVVPPAEFIPVAEDHGLIVALGRNVLLQACRGAAIWDPVPGLRDFDVSVNLSAHQLSDPQLPADIMAILARGGLAPERLLLEVTESALMNDVTASIAVLGEIRAAGVRLIIDDFGTGYSSLSYLRQLPVNGIKIDRSFVAELGLGTGDDAIVDAIIQLGHSLSLTITAEGVETPEQAAILRQLGCDTAQGYLYGRPARVATKFSGYVTNPTEPSNSNRSGRSG